ncbi:hypothetical protein GCM10007898_12560 [Dyella flagellata]|uniref:Pentapeptide repeat-containing protein n=2 Tax=Dyella flagellata TaxID=1867833 RepID=A0ABQ5X7V5_9GAMM|nr:hypothetical protein GCM10007898_12560 [Dyella flagellata]
MQSIDREETSAAPQADFALMFQGKYKLSMRVTPRRQYLSGSKDSPIVGFTTSPTQAMTFALYFAMDTGGGAAPGVILQVTPEQGDVPLPGGFIKVAGLKDDVQAMNTVLYPGQATMFDPDFLSEGSVRLRHRQANRYLMARTPKGDAQMTFWLPPLGRFDDEPWQLDVVQLWNHQTMKGSDLRYVRALRYVCGESKDLSFEAARLQQADFSGARLIRANFTKADCEAAHFDHARINDADFTGAVIAKASFDGVDASGAKFPNATFSKDSFGDQTGLHGASFEKATLTGAKFEQCILPHANFKEAKLAGASLLEATLRNADLSGAVLNGAKLDGADAGGASFVKCKMTGASLSKVKLAGANFKEATLTRACFKEAEFTLPESIKQPVDFTGATLLEIDFSGCDLRKATISGRPEFHKEKNAKPDETTRRALFCGAEVPLAVIGEVSWRMLDLSGAKIHGRPKSMKKFNAEYTIFPDNFDVKEETDLTGAKFKFARMVGIVLSKVTSEAESEKEETYPDFTGADLQRADLSEAFLEHAIFTSAVMHGVNLTGAQLSYATFESARLDTIQHATAGILRAELSYANLTNAKFSQAYLNKGGGADGANLSSAIFHGNKATVSNATLHGSIFSNAYLAGVDFSSAKAMDDINFAGACLLNCKFNNTSLQRAVFTGACLLGADFTEANLSGASMSGAVIAAASQTNKLKVINIFLNPRELDYGLTKIAKKSTNERTVCPSTQNGPCEESAWNRVTGLKEWTYKKQG